MTATTAIISGTPLHFPAEAEPFLPQRLPMRLIDTALGADDFSAESRTTIRPDNLLLDAQGAFPGAGLIEVMAQTIGIYAGRLRLSAGLRPSAGLLLGTRRLRLAQRSFPVGAVLFCRIEKTFESDDGLWQFDCRVALERPDGAREPAGEAMLTVFNPPPGYFDQDRTSAHAAPASDEPTSNAEKS